MSLSESPDSSPDCESELPSVSEPEPQPRSEPRRAWRTSPALRTLRVCPSAFARLRTPMSELVGLGVRVRPASVGGGVMSASAPLPWPALWLTLARLSLSWVPPPVSCASVSRPDPIHHAVGGPRLRLLRSGACATRLSVPGDGFVASRCEMYAGADASLPSSPNAPATDELSRACSAGARRCARASAVVLSSSAERRSEHATPWDAMTSASQAPARSD